MPNTVMQDRPAASAAAKPAIMVRLQDVYGRPTIYPMCPRAQGFARLAGKKTLSASDLNEIRSLGFAIFTYDEDPTILASMMARAV